MKKNLISIALFLCWSPLATAQETAISIAPQGLAGLDRPSEAGPTGGGRYGGIRLPEIISVGDVIPFQYQRDSGMVSDSFMVTGIKVEAGWCTLESKNSKVPGGMSEKMAVACRVLR
ncbi:hypothetical protein [Sulfuritalea sp.]|uniref:hypothetical protein n=1 Tax=Sulfuritalea sp. TaxID=2480090 RepID=UPI001AD4FE59|nr:hypothetical protein [Sulfuritalea sp.]MBN8475266.1 hypothetical protein [Sulfuritalea sp.]